MTTSRITRILATTVAAAILASCNISTGSGNPNQPPDYANGGIGGTGVSQGQVTAFGSIVVNGVHFDVGNAQLRRDGQPASINDFHVGEVVTVVGDFDSNTTGTAGKVYYRPLVVGPVTQPPASTDITVMGQLVHTNSRTVLLNANTLGDLASPSCLRVEVSGYRRADGSIQATLLRCITSSGKSQVRGTISQTSGSEFNIGGLRINASSVTNQEPANLNNDDRVQVIGTYNNNASTLIADDIYIDSLVYQPSQGEEVEIEGIVQFFIGTMVFSLGQQPVVVNSNTDYEGTTLANLAIGDHVEVEGRFNSHGIIVAEEVEKEAEPDLDLTGSITQIQCTSSACHKGIIKLIVNPPVNGHSQFQLLVTTSTIFEGDNGNHLNLSLLQVGDKIEVHANKDAIGTTITAIHIELE